MARVFQTGAELGAGSLLQFDKVTGTTVTSTAARVRSGTYAFYVNASQNIIKAVPSRSEYYLRQGMNVDIGNDNYIAFYEGTTVHVSVRFNGTTLIAYRGYASTVLQTVALAFPLDVYLLCEIYVRVGDAPDGRVVVKLDGNTIIDYTGDTRDGLTGVIDSIGSFCGASGGMYIDDIAINNTDGTAHNSWVGNGYCKAVKANATVSAQLLGSDADSVDNHLLVDDLPHDSDTTYVESGTVGQRDVYTLEDVVLAANEAVNAVSVIAIAKLDSAGAGALKVGISNDNDGTPTEVQSDPFALSSDNYKAVQLIVPTDPDDGAWVQSSINSMRATIEVA